MQLKNMPYESESKRGQSPVMEQEEQSDLKPVGTTSKVDQASNLFDGHPEDFVYSTKEGMRVRWKLDLILLPMVCCMFPLT